MNFTPACTRCHGDGITGTYWQAIDDNDYEPCDCAINRLIEEGRLGPGPDDPNAIEITSGWDVGMNRNWREESPREIKVHVRLLHYEEWQGWMEPPEDATDEIECFTVRARYRCWGKGAPE